MDTGNEVNTYASLVKGLSLNSFYPYTSVSISIVIHLKLGVIFLYLCVVLLNVYVVFFHAILSFR